MPVIFSFIDTYERESIIIGRKKANEPNLIRVPQNTRTVKGHCYFWEEFNFEWSARWLQFHCSFIKVMFKISRNLQWTQVLIPLEVQWVGIKCAWFLKFSLLMRTRRRKLDAKKTNAKKRCRPIINIYSKICCPPAL